MASSSNSMKSSINKHPLSLSRIVQFNLTLSFIGRSSFPLIGVSGFFHRSKGRKFGKAREFSAVHVMQQQQDLKKMKSSRVKYCIIVGVAYWSL
ncbi:unnamed protein product [Linum tenue]|uniref:Transmembrane protein n=1 Tax=Linum tenue TaxID=586396 RepID=A0AAV0HA85_9ROSI|nr:unnamed protein product [Linum tenue]